jgi:transposase
MRMCALLVGLPDVTVVGVGEWPKWLRVEVTTNLGRPSCCGRTAWHHGTRDVVLVDLPVFGRPARLVWCKQRWRCPTCGRTWTDQHPEIASARCALTTRAARWATVQVGRHGRSVQEVADDLVMPTHLREVLASGELLVALGEIADDLIRRVPPALT